MHNSAHNKCAAQCYQSRIVIASLPDHVYFYNGMLCLCLEVRHFEFQGKLKLDVP